MMKITILVLLVTITSCEQDYAASKVPSVIHNTINSNFPGATAIEWEKKSDSYEAEFDLNGVEYTAFVEPSGRLISYKYDIKPTELPDAASAFISSTYKDYKIDEAERVSKDDSVYYQATLERRQNKDVLIVFSRDGKLTEGVNYLK